MKKLIFIPANPEQPIIESVIRVEPSFEMVKGFGAMDPKATIEMVRIKYGQGLAWMLVDEDGLSKKLPPNPRASQWTGYRHSIVGPAVIYTGDFS